MKKTIYTLQVNNYMPEMFKITSKFMAGYAEKIGAEFKVISERKFPDMPITYEKFQIYELGQKDGNDWNIFFDADTFIHPETIDFTNLIQKDTVMNYNKDFANMRFRYDKYFKRDGRNIGCGNWMAIASDWCIDLWHPLEDISIDEAVFDIFPTLNEIGNIKMESHHLIDDYLTSRNIAKYGLKYATALQIMQDNKLPMYLLWHDYRLQPEDKLNFLKNEILTKLKLMAPE